MKLISKFQAKKFKECLILITFFFIVLILYKLNIPIPCLFHKLTKLYCPGCGVTRMCVSIFKLDFKSAFSYNAYAFILLCLAIIYFIVCIIKHKLLIIPNLCIYIIIIIGIIFAILRNIPYFSFLAPWWLQLY